MTQLLSLLLGSLLGYVLGSIPTGAWVCQMLRGVDIRQRGSGHTGGTNVARTAGFGAGAATAIADVALAALAVAATTVLTNDPWAGTAAGMMAVVGHNWSMFIGFGGGIGLSSLAGATLYRSPIQGLLMILVLLVVWLAFVRLLKVHRARATITVMIAIGPLLWLLGSPASHIAMSALGGAVVIFKTLPDWTRNYE